MKVLCDFTIVICQICSLKLYCELSFYRCYHPCFDTFIYVINRLADKQTVFSDKLSQLLEKKTQVKNRHPIVLDPILCSVEFVLTLFTCPDLFMI